MEKKELLKALKHISNVYLNKKDYISTGQINRAIDVVEDYDGELPKEINSKILSFDEKYNEIEMICRKERIMEKYYGVQTFSDEEPYFTTSQESDIKDMINDCVEIDTIISTIRKW